MTASVETNILLGLWALLAALAFIWLGQVIPKPSRPSALPLKATYFLLLAVTLWLTWLAYVFGVWEP